MISSFSRRLVETSMIRDNASTHHARDDDSSPIPARTSTIVEWVMLEHLLDLHCALYEVGKDELKDLPPIDGVDHLTQLISATGTFRRTLFAYAQFSLALSSAFPANKLPLSAPLEEDIEFSP